VQFSLYNFFFEQQNMKGLMLIWQTVTWSLWKATNSLIFEGKKVGINEIVDAIKYRSLDWFRARKHASVCLSYASFVGRP
jgi:hypothetical protein